MPYLCSTQLGYEREASRALTYRCVALGSHGCRDNAPLFIPRSHRLRLRVFASQIFSNVQGLFLFSPRLGQQSPRLLRAPSPWALDPRAPICGGIFDSFV